MGRRILKPSALVQTGLYVISRNRRAIMVICSPGDRGLLAQEPKVSVFGTCSREPQALGTV